MTPEGFTVYWLEKGKPKLRSLELGAGSPLSSSEIRKTILDNGARVPEDITIVPDSEIGSHWFKERIALLLEKSASRSD